MNLNRQLQLRMLQALKDHYPGHAQNFNQEFEKESDFIPNLYYLRGHNLLTGSVINPLSSNRLYNIRITEAGLDFLEDDGGVGAILRTVTVKLDVDQLRQLLAAKVVALSWPEEKKKSILEKIRDIPGELLQKVVMRYVERGLDSFPELLPDLLGAVSSGPASAIPPGSII